MYKYHSEIVGYINEKNGRKSELRKVVCDSQQVLATIEAPPTFYQYLYVNRRSTRREGLPEGYFFTFNGQFSVCEFWAPQNEQLAVDESTSLEIVVEFSQYITNEGRVTNKVTKA